MEKRGRKKIGEAKKIIARISSDDYNKLKKLVAKGKFGSIAEAVRRGIDLVLKEYEENKNEGKA